MLHIDIVFGFMVDELESFKDFSLALSMLLATINAANFAQRQNFEIPPKIETLVFLKNKNLCL
jgi:hypothetical protein